jgi:hypothetical protein
MLCHTEEQLTKCTVTFFHENGSMQFLALGLAINILSKADHVIFGGGFELSWESF